MKSVFLSFLFLMVVSLQGADEVPESVKKFAEKYVELNNAEKFEEIYKTMYFKEGVSEEMLAMGKRLLEMNTSPNIQEYSIGEPTEEDFEGFEKGKEYGKFGQLVLNLKPEYVITFKFPFNGMEATSRIVVGVHNEEVKISTLKKQ